MRVSPPKQRFIFSFALVWQKYFELTKRYIRYKQISRKINDNYLELILDSQNNIIYTNILLIIITRRGWKNNNFIFELACKLPPLSWLSHFQKHKATTSALACTCALGCPNIHSSQGINVPFKYVIMYGIIMHYLNFQNFLCIF